jgi:hypothetical protein
VIVNIVASSKDAATAASDRSPPLTGDDTAFGPPLEDKGCAVWRGRSADTQADVDAIAQSKNDRKRHPIPKA